MDFPFDIVVTVDDDRIVVRHYADPSLDHPADVPSGEACPTCAATGAVYLPA